MIYICHQLIEYNHILTKEQKFLVDNSNNEHEPRVNANEPKGAQKEFIISETNAKSNRRNKNDLKAGANIEINEIYSDELCIKITYKCI